MVPVPFRQVVPGCRSLGCLCAHLHAPPPLPPPLPLPHPPTDAGPLPSSPCLCLVPEGWSWKSARSRLAVDMSTRCSSSSRWGAHQGNQASAAVALPCLEQAGAPLPPQRSPARMWRAAPVPQHELCPPAHPAHSCRTHACAGRHWRPKLQATLELHQVAGWQGRTGAQRPATPSDCWQGRGGGQWPAAVRSLNQTRERPAPAPGPLL